ncbi:hypothetical protein Aam_036_027 [Acidocella aminolytica 101 = DSM 11237]|uniref:Uncharacterized protein n=1 Tax=Acidocella aminolytica 101 = DSM 11237 TaxID=1120923 RepID=A0A0D6PEC9_9PROT|nr:hypothetical protein Aam_036_027 [Acidocella aminolytica 101 = DSM 11237]GBQ43518.1 hypothetical protein AA11237_3299 [Acidocella aminolytica 101 = DSM 11237]
MQQKKFVGHNPLRPLSTPESGFRDSRPTAPRSTPEAPSQYVPDSSGAENERSGHCLVMAKSGAYLPSYILDGPGGKSFGCFGAENKISAIGRGGSFRQDTTHYGH